MQQQAFFFIIIGLLLVIIGLVVALIVQRTKIRAERISHKRQLMEAARSVVQGNPEPLEYMTIPKYWVKCNLDRYTFVSDASKTMAVQFKSKVTTWADVLTYMEAYIHLQEHKEFKDEEKKLGTEIFQNVASEKDSVVLGLLKAYINGIKTTDEPQREQDGRKLRMLLAPTAKGTETPLKMFFNTHEYLLKELNESFPEKKRTEPVSLVVPEETK